MSGSAPLRFLMVTTFYPPYHFGGDAMHVYRLTQALARRGHRVDVTHSIDAYHLQHPGEPELPFEHHPNTRRLPLETRHPMLSALAAHQLGRPALYGKRLRAILEDGRYDVIHFHNTSLMGAPGVLGLGRSLKLYTANEYWLICPTHVLFRFDREACTERRCLACTLHSRRPPQLWRHTGTLPRQLRHIDCLLMPSRFALEQHRAQGVDRPMVHLPYFVPGAAEDSEPGPAAGSPAAPYFLYVGRLEKLKGLQEVLPLFRHYRAAGLVVVGDGSYASELHRLARDLPHVRFTGRLHPSRVAALYRDAIAALVPSLCYETFGLAVAESLCHGTPALVRRIGALAENVEQSGGGLCFEDGQECVAAMERLRTEPGLRDALGRRGREAARRLWSEEAHLAQYLGLVERQLAAQRESAAGEGGVAGIAP